MSDTGKRILYVNPVADMVGGAEVSLLNLVRQVGQHGYTPVALLPGDGTLSRALAEAGCEMHAGPLYPFMIEQDIAESIANGGQAILSLPALSRLVSSLNVDLVHVNSYRIGIPLSIIARRAGIPVIWHVRDIPNSQLKRRLLALSLWLADRVICISHAVKDAVCPQQRDNCLVIWNGVDAEPFAAPAPISLRQEWRASSDTVVYCTVGQLVPWKGQDCAIRAFARLPADVDARLIIVGAASDIPWQSGGAATYEESLHRLVRELGAQERVHFLGHRNDMAALMNAADVYIHATTRPEPFGRTIIEAMAASLPVIAPAWGGIPEIVEHGATGLLYPPGCIDVLADYMRFAAKNRDLMRCFGTLGRRAAQSKFTIEQHGDEVCAVYDKLLADSR